VCHDPMCRWCVRPGVHSLHPRLHVLRPTMRNLATQPGKVTSGSFSGVCESGSVAFFKIRRADSVGPVSGFAASDSCFGFRFSEARSARHTEWSPLVQTISASILHIEEVLWWFKSVSPSDLQARAVQRSVEAGCAQVISPTLTLRRTCRRAWSFSGMCSGVATMISPLDLL